MFSVHTTPEKFETAIISGLFRFEQTSGRQGNHIMMSLLCHRFRPDENEKLGFSNFSGLKSKERF